MKEKTPTATRQTKTPMPYFSLSADDQAKTADIFIFGNIASDRGGLSGLLQAPSDQSSYNLANQIARIPEDYDVTVHVNSNGGELKEGLGIYNVLKDRNVTTICEGFAASAGSIIFAAGKRRIMQPASLLFVHQASMEAGGNADDFQKYADDLKILTDAAVAAYKESGVNVTDAELDEMLRSETWIPPEDAVRMGFATEIAGAEDEGGQVGGVPVVHNDMMSSIMDIISGVPAVHTGESGVLVDVGNGKRLDLSDLMNAFVQTSGFYEKTGKMISLAETLLGKLGADPELAAKLKAAAEVILATPPTPTPAPGVTKKGFFNFNKEV